MDLDDAFQTFIIESKELLEGMEEELLGLTQIEQPLESLNSIFRAAHTIKGSAGLFNLDEVVTFTHVVENLLDKMREHQLKIDDEIVSLLLECADHMGLLVSLAEEDEGECSPEVKNAGDKLLNRLEIHSGITVARTNTENSSDGEPDGGDGEIASWHISLRLRPEVLRDGMDPLSLFNYLATLGDIEDMIVLDDAMVSLDEFDAETCYLGFEIRFKSAENKRTIESAFDFVRENSVIKIVPVSSQPTEYIKQIEELPEAEFRLGEILVQCGSLTPTELEEALARQKQESMNANEAAPLGEVLIRERLSVPPVVNAALEKQTSVRSKIGKPIQTIRVDAEKLDGHMNLVGELVTASAGAILRANEIADPKLNDLTSTLARLVEEVRDSALRLRMVQVGPTFNKFQRVVHDMSKELNKNIDLVINGADTDLDKTVIEKIGDPLTHLVRNSIDHGIETPTERAAQGKSVNGKLTLSAYHDSGSVVIEVEDDGAGLKRDRILEKAIEKGLVLEGQNLSDKDINNLIFEPGFSTADKVSDISGRGVGMDVVKRNITDLRGTIELESKANIGSVFRIRLPLTLAIIDGFLVGVEDSSFVIPLDMIQECVLLNSVNCKVELGRDYINLRGKILPFIRLRDLFAVKGKRPQREHVVVINYADSKAAVVVDRLIGESQIVIKPLGKMFSYVPGVGGSTILGNGEVALILDVPGLIKRVANMERITTQIAV